MKSNTQTKSSDYHRGGMPESQSTVSQISDKQKTWKLRILFKHSYVVDKFVAVRFFDAREQACVKYHVGRDAVISEGYTELE